MPQVPRPLSAPLLFGLLLTSCQLSSQIESDPAAKPLIGSVVAQEQGQTAMTKEVNSWTLVLEEQTGTGQDSATSPSISAFAIDESTGEQLFAGLPTPRVPLAVFPWVENGPLPPSDSTIAASFAQPLSSAEASDAGLSLLYSSPRGVTSGNAPIAIRFNQKVRPVDGSLGNLMPSITPELEGQWRWLGDSSLFFDRQNALPGSSEFTINVPQGLTSQNGENSLEEDVSWQFSTQAPTLVSYRPLQGPQPVDTSILLAFDQEIDPEQLLKSLHLDAGGVSHGFRLANKEQWQKLLSQGDLPEHGVAIQPIGNLPANQLITVTVKEGMGSSEGPLSTETPQSFTFNTLPAFAYDGFRCGNGDRCVPTDAIELTFNAAIQEGSSSGLSVIPEVAALEHRVQGNLLSVTGQFQTGLTYTLTVPATLANEQGQTLSQSRSIQFEMQGEAPLIHVPKGEMIRLAANQPPIYTVYSVNHPALRVRAWQVSPDDYQAFLQSRHLDPSQPAPAPPGRAVYHKIIEVNPVPDHLMQTNIDLSPALEGSSGHLVLLVESSGVEFDNPTERRFIYSWLQQSALNAELATDSENLNLWLSSATQGGGVPGARLTLMPDGEQSTTDNNGMARLKAAKSAKKGRYITAYGKNSSLILPLDDLKLKQNIPQSLNWRALLGRSKLTAGEHLAVAGYILGASEGSPLTYLAKDSTGALISQGSVPLINGPNFAFEAVLNDKASPGIAYLTLQMDGQEGPRLPFSISEGQSAPVSISLSSRAAQDGSTTLSAHLKDKQGQGMAQHAIKWSVKAQEQSFKSAKFPDFSFSSQSLEQHLGLGSGAVLESQVESTTQSDAQGRSHLKIGPEPSKTITFTASALVEIGAKSWQQDLSGLQFSHNTYVGLRSDKQVYQLGETATIQSVATTTHGLPASERTISLTSTRMIGEMNAKGQVEYQEAALESCDGTFVDTPIACKFTYEQPGIYRLVASTIDDNGSDCKSTHYIVVAGPSLLVGNAEQRVLLAEQQSYNPNETAQLFPISKNYPIQGVLRASDGETVKTQGFTLDNAKQAIPVELNTLKPGAIAYSAQWTSSGEPGVYYRGQGSFNIRKEMLSVDVRSPESQWQPGGMAPISIAVTDANGQPVSNAKVLVEIAPEGRVDAASIGGASDPMKAQKLLATKTWQPSEQGLPEFFRPAASVRFGGTAPLVATGQNPRVPLPSKASPSYQAILQTDAQGLAQSDVSLGQDMQSLSLRIHAFQGTQGEGSAQLRRAVQQPLMLKVVDLPRFYQGDRMAVPLTIFNNTAQHRIFQVAARADGISVENAPKQIEMSPFSEGAVTFWVEAPTRGSARLQWVAAAIDENGSIDEALRVETIQAINILAPGNHAIQQRVLRSDGGSVALALDSDNITANKLSVSIAMGPSTGSSLSGVYQDLEDLSSGLLLGLSTSSPPEQMLTRAAISSLLNKQRADGGFSNSGDSQDFLTVHAAHALHRAQSAGFDVPFDSLNNAQRYLRRLKDGPSEAYANYVLTLMGKLKPGHASNRVAQLDFKASSTDVLAWYLASLIADVDGSARERILLTLEERLSSTYPAIIPTMADGKTAPVGDLASDLRSTALVLGSLLTVEPGHDMVEKLLKTLVEAQGSGSLNNQEQTFFALALEQLGSPQNTAYARLWLDDAYMGESILDLSHSIQRFEFPAELLQSSRGLSLENKGSTPFYMSSTLDYQLPLVDISQGLSLGQVLEAVDDPSDVRRVDGQNYEIRQGTRVKVRVFLWSSSPEERVGLRWRESPALSAGAQSSENQWIDHNYKTPGETTLVSHPLGSALYEYSWIGTAEHQGQFVLPPVLAEGLISSDKLAQNAPLTLNIQ